MSYNLAKIKNSKELLKKYINAFVYSIKIIEHSVNIQKCNEQ
jgi:hypothetical protein